MDFLNVSRLYDGALNLSQKMANDFAAVKMSTKGRLE